MRLFTDEGEVLDVVPPDGAVTWTTTPRVSGYVRAEVRRPDPANPSGAMVALTNPIFLGRLG